MPTTEKEHQMYQCGDCQRIVYSMETGRGGELKCCDRKMKEMSEEEKVPYHPRFLRPGSP
jgi:hypothetical protein